MQQRSRAGVLAVALVATLTPFTSTIGTAGATEHPARARVTVRAEVDGVVMQGAARSRRTACLTDRQVRIIQQVGTRGGGDDQLFHAEALVPRTAHRATWKVGFTLPPGRYYGVLRGDAWCHRAASATVRVPPTKAGPTTAVRSAARAPVTVTIAAAGTDLSGTLTSPRAGCVHGRTVVVWRQRGARGGGDDERFASDVSSAGGGRTATWSTGTTGAEGRFYARVARTPTCRGDESPTVTARR